MATDKSGLKFGCGLGIFGSPRGATTAAVVLAAAIACCMSPRAGAADRFAAYDLEMFDRPAMESKGYRKLIPSGLKELWFRALDRPDAELQRMVIDTLAIAQRRGVEGMTEAKPRLIALLQQPDQRLDVLRAVAQTLIVLDARESADVLNELSATHGLSIAQIVEPALAEWDSQILEKTWLQRVENAESGQTMMAMAIDGLGKLGTVKASQPLLTVVRNPGQTARLRMSAARALGRIHASGLLEDAESLAGEASSPPYLNAILAVEMLDRHDDPMSVEFLTGLVDHESTIVQAAALERLYRIDIHLVDAHADRRITSPDVNVRRWCARAMIATKNVERIPLVAGLLNDVNPGLRREVASGLIELAEIPDLRDPVIDHTSEVLNGNQWQGCEQACVVLTRLDHEPSGPRMVELLGHERGEVKVASAWGLTKLRIEALLPDMLDHAQSVYDGFRSNQLNDNMPGASLQVAHLFIAFGDQRYRAADSVMRRYLPKDYSMGFESRAAAAWALGMVYEDDPQEDLIKIMIERLNDAASMEPEIGEVREMSAISLGRMKAESAMGSLRKFAPGMRHCYWAIERITGEPMPPVEQLTYEIGGWFLAPIRDAE